MYITLGKMPISTNTNGITRKRSFLSMNNVIMDRIRLIAARGHKKNRLKPTTVHKKYALKFMNGSPGDTRAEELTMAKGNNIIPNKNVTMPARSASRDITLGLCFSFFFSSLIFLPL